MGSRGPWVSASDLAEYAYCPRSYWYSSHPEEVEGSIAPDPRARRGVRYHQRALSAEQRHDAHVGRYVLLLLVGLAVVTASLYVLGAL